MTLKELEIGKPAVIRAVGGEGALRQHFLDMGILPGTETTVVKYAPMGDPLEIRLHGYELTLRLDDAARIEVEPTCAKKVPEQSEANRANSAKAANSIPKAAAIRCRTARC